MVDHIKMLLLNRDGISGYSKVTDGPSSAVLARFGVTGYDETDGAVVSMLLPLAMAPDLAQFRKPFDQRTTPQPEMSPYDPPDGVLSPSGLYASVIGDGWWDVSSLFESSDQSALPVLDALRDAASSRDAPYALGAVLIACAYRRLLLQGEA